MWWLLAALVLVALGLMGWGLRALRECGVRGVVEGRWTEAVVHAPRPDLAVERTLSAAAGPVAGGRESEPQGSAPAGGQSGTLGDAAIGGGLAATVGLVDWWHVDVRVLEAVEHWTHTSVDNGLDLWRTMRDEGYAFDTAGFERNLRGHVGEQEVEAQLSSWAGDRVGMSRSSNNPGYDVRLDGRPVNVKVGQDASAIREHLDEHPDIPVIVNEDMQGLPTDALRLDLTQPFDPDLLAEHSVIVADGLLLSDLQDALADALGPSLASYGVDDLFDGAGEAVVPGLGSVIRVVRSGIREHRLEGVHGDSGRKWRNIGTDASYVGGGLAGGAALGTGLGLLIDVATGGATAGAGTAVIGPAIMSAVGAFFGSKKATEERMRPLTEARAATGRAVVDYDEAVSAATRRAMRVWAEDVLPQAEGEAERAARTLRAATSDVTWRARRDLERAEQAAGVDRLSLLEDASRRVEEVRRKFSRHPLVRRRIRAWHRAAAGVRGGSPTAVLDVVTASPGGMDLVRLHVEAVTRRRAVVLASTGIELSYIHRQALLERQALVTWLVAERDRLERKVVKGVRPQLKAIKRHTAVVRHELVATGARTQQWVDEHLPQPQKK
jgi:hypothetical protein